MGWASAADKEPMLALSHSRLGDWGSSNFVGSRLTHQPLLLEERMTTDYSVNLWYISMLYPGLDNWEEVHQEMGLRVEVFSIRAMHEPLGGQDTEPDTLFKGSRNSDVTGEHANQSHEQHLQQTDLFML